MTTYPRRNVLLLSVILATLSARAALNAPPAENEEELFSTIRSTGEATLTAKPDHAQIEIGVVTQAPEAKAAAESNARQTEKVLKEMKEIAGSGEDTFQTANFNVQPQYKYSDKGEPPTVVSYTATNTLRVHLDDLSLLSKVIDAATRSGANMIQGIQFSLKNETAARAKALRQATEQAAASAEAIAATLKMRVVRVISAEESEMPARPMPRMAMGRMADAEAVSTPIEPGRVDVYARVTLTVEVQSL